MAGPMRPTRRLHLRERRRRRRRRRRWRWRWRHLPREVRVHARPRRALARAASAAAHPATGSVRPTGIGPRRATHHDTERGLRSLGASCLMRKAISMQSACNQRPVVLPDWKAIRHYQRPSKAIRGHQRRGWSDRLESLTPSILIRCQQSEVFRGHQRSSEVIRGHQRSSSYPLPSHQLSSRARDGAR